MGKIIRNSIVYGGGDNSVELTQAEYNALTEEQKKNGTTYYITDVNPEGDQIDSELSLESENPVQNKVITEYVTQLSNPNLLINPDFRINQRGQSEYTGYCYTVDRWIINENSVAKIVDGGISINSNFWQVAENSSELLGKTVTLSAKIDGVINSGTVTLPISFTGSDTTVPLVVNFENANALILIENGSQKIHVANIDPLGNTVIVQWVKLELGSIATPFIPPDPASELLKCQRYGEPIGYNLNTNYSNKQNGWVEATKTYCIQHTFGIEKRVIPTVAIPSDLTNALEIFNVSNITPSSMSVYPSKQDVRIIGLTGSEHINRVVSLNISLFADAEIY